MIVITVRIQRIDKEKQKRGNVGIVRKVLGTEHSDVAIGKPKNRDT